jgi:hypothetical protein
MKILKHLIAAIVETVVPMGILFCLVYGIGWLCAMFVFHSVTF